MAWTAPRTWVTGEIVTAALLNTHLRDNLLQTAPAIVTTAGDLVHATGANTLARVVPGTNAQFLRGGGTPSWSNTLLGDFNVGTTGAPSEITIFAAGSHLKLHETDGSDADDVWFIEVNSDQLKIRFFDDSESTNHEALQLSVDDFILHTGDKSQNEGAVVIEDDSLGSTGLTTSGTGALAVTITTGGPAFVVGWFSIVFTRSAAGSAGDIVSAIPHDDGASIDVAFNLATTNDWADAMIPSNGDISTYAGYFYKRVTSSDTSTWSVNLFASVNSVFTATASRLLVASIQYPT